MKEVFIKIKYKLMGMNKTSEKLKFLEDLMNFIKNY